VWFADDSPRQIRYRCVSLTAAAAAAVSILMEQMSRFLDD
jgi:hypothetical protein